MPALVDPNTNLTIWESNAILTYLVETYDKERKLSFEPNTHDAWHATQYLFFQASGQGPIHGNGHYFTHLAQPSNPEAVLRFGKEAVRVTSVLETILGKCEPDEEGNRWLVGGKCSYADLSFVPYQVTAGMIFGGEGKGGYEEEDFPMVKKWVRAMVGRESVRNVFGKTAPWNTEMARGLWE